MHRNHGRLLSMHILKAWRLKTWSEWQEEGNPEFPGRNYQQNYIFWFVVTVMKYLWLGHWTYWETTNFGKNTLFCVILSQTPNILLLYKQCEPCLYGFINFHFISLSHPGNFLLCCFYLSSWKFFQIAKYVVWSSSI